MRIKIVFLSWQYQIRSCLMSGLRENSHSFISWTEISFLLKGKKCIVITFIINDNLIFLQADLN